MFKKTLISIGLITTLNASMTHTFYFNNNHELMKENKVTNKKIETNEKLTISDKTNTDIKIGIKITETLGNNTPIEKEHGWNPLKSFFKYQVEPVPNEKTLLEREYPMKNSQFYILTLVMDNNELTDFNFSEAEEGKNIEAYLTNKKNIVIKAETKTSTFHILNKKHDINFNDNFIIKFKNKTLELNYKDNENVLFN